MGLKEFNREIERGFKEPVYVLSSKDEFLLDDAALSIKGLLNADDYTLDDFDLSFADTKVSVEGLMELLNMMPFMGNRRTVFVRHAERFSKKDMTRLAEYVSNPCPSSLLVMFLMSSDTRNAITTPFKGVKHIELTLSSRDIGGWINQKAKGLGFRFTEEALSYLIAITGDNTGILFSETSKFAALNKDVVDVQDIGGLVYAGADHSVFELIRHLRSNNIREAIKGLNRLENTVEPYQLLGALCWDYVTKPPRGVKDQLKDTLQILHEADLLTKRAALCSADITFIKLLKVIK